MPQFERVYSEGEEPVTAPAEVAAPVAAENVEAAHETTVETHQESAEPVQAEAVPTEAEVLRAEEAKAEKLGAMKAELAESGTIPPAEVKQRQLADAEQKLAELQAMGDPAILQADIDQRVKKFNSFGQRASRWFTKNVTREFAAPGTSELNGISRDKQKIADRNELPGKIAKLREEIAQLT